MCEKIIENKAHLSSSGPQTFIRKNALNHLLTSACSQVITFPSSLEMSLLLLAPGSFPSLYVADSFLPLKLLLHLLLFLFP